MTSLDVNVTLDPGTGLSTATMTTADGRTLRYVHAGDGSPTVVFEAGLGACASEWVTVQRLVAAETHTVSYDRAGHGGSTTDTKDRSLPRMTEDLDALIEHVSPGAPVVLVAHSWGGPIVRCYAERHAGRIAGVVMVDTTIASTMPDKVAKMMPAMFRVMHALHYVGLAKPLMRRATRKRPSPDMPAADLVLLERDMISRQSAKTSIAEAKATSGSAVDMARWEAAGLPDVPVISVRSSESGRAGKTGHARFIAETQAQMDRHPQGECRVIAGAGHLVPQEQPLATAQAILDVVSAVRRS